MTHHNNEENQHHERKTPNQKSEEKISKDIEIIEWSEEDIQGEEGRFCINEKEYNTELGKLKIDFKFLNANVSWHNSAVNYWNFKIELGDFLRMLCKRNIL